MIITRTPELGEKRRGWEIGHSGNKRGLFSWLPCNFCGKPRWVCLIHGKPEHNHCPSCKTSPFRTEDAILLYRTGLSLAQVGKILHCSGSAIKRRLTPLGIVRGKGDTRRGSKLSSDTCKAISISRKKLLGDPIAKEKYCMGHNNPFYGRKHNPETMAKMKFKLSLMLSGENNPNWQGGKSLEPYTSEFKRIIRHKVYERDNYQCQECGVTFKPNSGNLVAHHKNRNKKDCSLGNLVTLCRICHGKTAMAERWGKEVVKTL